MEQRLIDHLTKRKGNGLLRGLDSFRLKADGCILSGDREFVNFSSNDYLGLSSHPDILRAAGMLEGKVFGSSASRLMTGSTLDHAHLERMIADLKGKPAALVFNSGYQANIGVVSALCGRGDVVFTDRLNHASIVDGIKLSGAKLIRYRHNDTAHLEELLSEERAKYRNSMVVTETLFSMDGDIAPLDGIIDLKEKYDSFLIADEAHATGVFGRNGEGVLEKDGPARRCDVIVGTFGKALGSFGAFAATSGLVKEFLVNSCRSFIYSTALPVPVIRANIAALKLLEKEPQRRATLLSNAGFFREELKDKGLNVLGDSQIIPVILGDTERTVLVSEALKEMGYWVTPVRPPTVPEGTARLRLSLTYCHERVMLKKFASDIAKVCRFKG